MKSASRPALRQGLFLALGLEQEWIGLCPSLLTFVFSEDAEQFGPAKLVRPYRGWAGGYEAAPDRSRLRRDRGLKGETFLLGRTWQTSRARGRTFEDPHGLNFQSGTKPDQLGGF